jgi:hypothetical protein
MAVDSYPLLLVPPDWSIRSLPLYQHPLRDELQAAVRADPALGRLFAKDTSALGASGFIYTSLGRGNTIQASRFGEVIIVSAWDTATMASGSVCLDQLVEQAIRNIDTLRDAVNGGNPRVRALVAFTGFTTNDAQPISTPWGPLRPLHEWERELAPTALRGTVSGAHPDGRQVTVSYSGEMVLETEVPYAVLIDYMLDLENLPPKLPTIEGADTLRRRLEGIQLATVLATDRPAGSWVAARPAWTWIGDPFGYGPNIAWSDARSSPGFMPYELTPAECDSVAQWTGLVEAHWSPRIDIAVRRLLSAANARTDMADRLVDSVIVWENLFGTVEGEPRLRISAALAWLLTGDPIDREARQLELKRLYDYRSKIVHGGKPDEVALGEQANAALMHARDALRALFSDRTDVLALPDGAARSLRMIMGG